jgi:hypothetical protein
VIHAGEVNLGRPAIVFVAAAMGCGGIQYDPKTATFYEGKKGGVVLTPNGAYFHDNDDVPRRVVFHDPEEPWRAPLGFILPKSGKFTKTSTATTLASQGIAIVLRPSDTRVPSWGGEILVRVDVHATAAAGTTRDGASVAIVVDGEGEAFDDGVATALERLGGRDRVTIIDARGARVLVPTIPATHRSLVLAAAAQRLRPGGPRDLGAAIRAAAAASPKRIVVLTSDPQAHAIAGAHGKGVAWPIDPTRETVVEEIRAAIPPVGPVTFRDLTVTFDGSPAPSRVLESTSGDAIWTLDGSDVPFADVRAGDARAEVLRVTVPAWVPGTRFALHVTARATDATTGVVRSWPADLWFTFDDDLERIADSRHGDVIAYASALATMHRLHAAFVGDAVGRIGGLLPLARMQAQSLAALARDFPDRGFAEDAAVLQSLLGAVAP